MWSRLKLFLNPVDGRYEDLKNGLWYKNVFRDFTAGLIVAMVAIPLAMGFAMASGLKPEHGIVGGAVAGLMGALFGGSKYQVYGPTAAFIPVIAGLMAIYGSSLLTYEEGHGFLVLTALVAGGILMLMGLLGLGKYVSWVPHSIVVGFTIGIAATIALSQIGEVLGLTADVKGNFLKKCQTVSANLGQFNLYALLLALGTFVVTKYLLKVSVYIPAPLIALGLCTALTTTVLSSSGLKTVEAKYGPIPRNLLVFTPPHVPEGELHSRASPDHAGQEVLVYYSAEESALLAANTVGMMGTPGGPGPLLTAATLPPGKYETKRDQWYTVLLPLIPSSWASPGRALLVLDLIYFAFAIIFVSAIESLLCSRMADRLADNRGQPFNPNKELWGQGWVNTVVPLINGFPHTGALARTATNIKLGAVSPLAGIFKCVLKLLLAAFLASFLEKVPMACIGGILMFVAFNMVKGEEVKQVLRHNWFHIVLMAYTAGMVILTDFLTGVLTAILLYAVLGRFLDRPAAGRMKEGELLVAEMQPGDNGHIGAPQSAPTQS